MKCLDFDLISAPGATKPCCHSLRDRHDQLIETTAQLNSSLDLPTILRRILHTASRLTNTETASIMLVNPDTGDLRFEASLDDAGEAIGAVHGAIVPLDASIAGKVFTTGESIAVHDTTDDPRFFDRIDHSTGVKTRNLLAVPLRVDETTIGVVEVVNRADDTPWSEQDVDALSFLANQSAIAIQTARLHMAELERQRMEREFAIGANIQLGMIPAELSRINGWEIQGSFFPAREVGGDFYDEFPLPGGRIGIAIADVCGKGLGAALFMTLSRTLLRAFSQFSRTEGWDDSTAPTEGEATASHIDKEMATQTVVRANDYIATVHAESSMFFTLFFAILDPSSGRLTYVNGGHEPPIVLGSDGDVVARLDPTGPAIGAFNGAPFHADQLQIKPGETLLAFTDGVTEASAPNGELFSDQRLLQLVSRPAPSVSALMDRVMKGLLAHVAQAPQSDDITLLGLRRLAESAPAIYS